MGKGNTWACPDCGRAVFRYVLVGSEDPEATPPSYAVVENGKIVLSIFDGIIAECTNEDCLCLDHETGFRGEKDVTLDAVAMNAKIVSKGSGEEFKGKVKVQHKCGAIYTIPDDCDIETDMDKKRFVVTFTASLKCDKCGELLFKEEGQIAQEK